MKTVLLVDGENFKGKIKSVFKEAGKGKVVWHEYDFKGSLDTVLSGIVIDQKIFYFARIKEHEDRSVGCMYLGFEVQPNKGLSYSTNKTILIRNSEVLEFGKIQESLLGQ